MSDDEVQLPPARLGPGRDARTPGKPADGEPGANVPEGAIDLLTGIHSTGRLELGRYGAAVLATPRAEAAPFITLSDTTD